MVIKLNSQWETERPFNLLSWGHWFTFANLILALLLSSFYIIDYTMPESPTGWFYLASTWLGHFAFLSLSCFILTIFPVITLFPYKRHIRGVSAIMASIMQLYLFLDVLAYRGLGYHLTSSSFKQIREVEDVYVAMMGDSYFVMVLCVFVSILAYQFMVSNLTWKRIHQLQAFKYRYRVAGLLIFSFFVSHFMHIWGDATLNGDIAKQGSMFPAHYPLTAKTLLARYDLIDLNEYNSNKTKQAVVNAGGYELVKTTTFDCKLHNPVPLSVTLLPADSEASTRAWLTDNNVTFQSSSQLNITNDFSSLIFNFSSGLPGLYLPYKEDVNINSIFEAPLISVQLLTTTDKDGLNIDQPTQPQVYVFFDEENEAPFYRTNVILVGFSDTPDAAFTPQNIVASYLSSGLGCDDFVLANLVDRPFEQLDASHIATHYSSGYFNFVYKDNSLLFKNGKLVANRTYSTDKKVDANVDIFLIKQAVSNLTKRRKKTSQSTR